MECLKLDVLGECRHPFENYYNRCESTEFLMQTVPVIFAPELSSSYLHMRKDFIHLEITEPAK